VTPWLEAALLGALQGVAEFLPISSDGHLALASLLFDVHDGGLTLHVVLHAGTLLATVLVLRERLLAAFVEGLRALTSPSRLRTTAGGQDALFVVVASVPTAVIGLLARDAVESLTREPLAVGLGFLGTTAVLLATRFSKEGRVEHPGVGAALLVGVAQGLAVAPGLSRSGITIAALLFLGLARSRAFELSMLMSVPAVTGAVLLEARHALTGLTNPGAALLGVVVALLVGIGALLALQRVVVGGRFAWFAAWTGPLAVATVAMSIAWP
jgi:undecaprenyl-diphosphatase